jgi:hypothetical protein
VEEKMKRFTLIILIISVTSLPSQAKYSGGSGEPNNPYQIANVNDLMTLANDANDYNKCFIQTSDIDLDPNLPGRQVFTKAVIAPDINDFDWFFQGTAFTGVFNGAGHKILNLTINTYGLGNGCLGLFGYVIGGNISNLGIENVNISPGDYSWPVGGLAGFSEDSVTNCFSSGNITAAQYTNGIGGLIGINTGRIDRCHSTVNITSGSYLGGLVGENYGTIISSSSQGTITGGTLSECLGGLVGQNGTDGCDNFSDGTISICFSTSDVNGNDNATEVGGLLGRNEYSSTIQYSYSTGNVRGEGSLGGIVGYNRGKINACFATSSVTGGGYASSIGGVAGTNDEGIIENSYSNGNVTGINYIGGAIGYNYDSYIEQCYSNGLVTGQNYVGGFLGRNSYGYIYNSYFLDVAGPNNGFGTPLTDTQMKQQASFVGWDFVWETANGTYDFWAICEGVSYPNLAFQFIPGDFDNNKDVNFIDFATLAAKWIQADSSFYCGGIDLTGDGLVDLDDLALMCDFWLGLTTPVPAQAANPIPNNDSTDINVMSDLSWTAGYRAASHDVYFGTDNPPPFCINQMENVFNPGTLDTNTIYYWRIDEKNTGGTTTGVLWSFKTIVQLPGQASNPTPIDGANNINVSPSLSWTAGELATSHDVYFGTTNPPSFWLNDTNTFCDTPLLDPNTTYYWRIDEKNGSGITTGTVWNFTTAPTPVFTAAGTVAAGTTSITPSLPADIQTNDILLLFVETPNWAVTITDANGGTWAEVTKSPQATGTAGAADATRLTAFWSRYNGSQGAPTATAALSDQIIGRIIAVRGAAASGNPWDVTSGNVSSLTILSYPITGATTTVPNTLVVAVVANTVDTTDSLTLTWVNSNLTSLTERIDNNTDIGLGGGFGLATGVMATAGNYGATTVTLLYRSTKAMMTIALKP